MKGCRAFFRLALAFGLIGGLWHPLALVHGEQLSPDDPDLEELLALFEEGNRLVEEGEHEQSLAVFEELEARARELEDPFWLTVGFWKQGQYYVGLGDFARSLEFFDNAFEALLKTEERQGETLWSSRWLLSSNLVMTYRALGQIGEAHRVHRMAIHDAIAFFRETHGKDIRADPFSLALESEETIRFFDRFLLDEARFRFLAGETKSALALTQKIIERHEGQMEERSSDLSGLAQAYADQIYRLHRIGRHQEAMVVSRKLLSLEENRFTADELNRERVRAAYYRIKGGERPASLVAQAEQAMRMMHERRHMPARLEAVEYLARIYFHVGDTARAFFVLNEAIEESRAHQLGGILAELLLVRAELRLEIGRAGGVETDLREALSLLRQQGQLRLKVAGYALYARHLLAQDRLDQAREIAVRGIHLARQFDEPVWLKRLLVIWNELFERMLAEEMEEVDPALWVDLQPVRMTTRVMEGEFARGRFVLTNPGPETFEGTLTVTGRSTESAWNDDRTLLAIEIDAQAEAHASHFRVRLPPRGDVTVYLQTAPASGGVAGEVIIGWASSGSETVSRGQTSYWYYDAMGDGHDVAVVTANVAMKSPFYAVPLYQEIYYRRDDAIEQSIRVRTSHPSRVEIVDHLTGRLIAVDATGDGDFSRAGDLVFRDQNRDGFPDLTLTPAEDVAPLLLYIFPEPGHDPAKDLTVEVDVLEEDEWWLAATNVFIPARRNLE